MTSDQDTKVVAEPQVQQVQEVKDSSHLVSTGVLIHILGTLLCCKACSCLQNLENFHKGVTANRRPCFTNCAFCYEKYI